MLSKAHCYAETTMELTCADAIFTAKGKAVREDGWKEIESMFRPERKAKEEKEIKNLPVVSKGDVLTFKKAEIKEGKTSPPKHFTEDTLLQAMENAGADEMPEEAERKGIGTPATCAGIIEKLVQKGVIERKGNVERQLEKVPMSKKEDYKPKTYTKQEIDVKTEFSNRVIPIPDILFEAILEERQKY